MGATITHSTGVITPVSMPLWESTNEARTIMHPILGRPDDDVTFRPAALRKGTLTLVFADSATAYSARAALLIPQQLDLAHTAVPEVGMSFVVADGEVGDVIGAAQEWTVTVPFREVSS